MSESSSSSSPCQESPPPENPPPTKYAKTRSDPHYRRFSLDSLNESRTAETGGKKHLQKCLDDLKNPFGHQYSKEQSQLFLCQLHGSMLTEKMSPDRACKLLAMISGVSNNTLHDLLSEFQESKTVPSPDSSHRGIGNPNHPLH